jgi:hypothetical protein
VSNKKLSKEGKALAQRLAEECAPEIKRLKRNVEVEVKVREKAEVKAAAAEEKSASMRLLKNSAHASKRAAERKLEASEKKGLKKAIKREHKMSKLPTSKLPAHVRARVKAAEADMAAAHGKTEAIQGEVKELEKLVATLRSKLDPKSRVEFDRLRDSTGFGTPTLKELLGKEGEMFSQGIIELMFRLMAGRLSAPQAVAVIRTFVAVLHSESVKGCDYRIPSAQRFNEWCRYLEPIWHFLAVTSIKLSVQTHLSSNATTKKHIHPLMALYLCELPNGLIVDVVSVFSPSFRLAFTATVSSECRRRDLPA